MPSQSNLRLLGELIRQSIDKIESRLEAASVEFPSPADPFDPTSDAESVLLEAEMLVARSHIVAAASQLIAMVRAPVQTIMDYSLQFHLPSCIRATAESNMVEIVREAGPQGIHVRDIAKINNTDPAKAGRILRLLATHHIFIELSPDVFCANRLSSILDSGKSVAEVQQTPSCRYTSASGILALVLMHTDEGFKGSAYLTEAFTNPATAHSVRATDSPWNLAARTDVFLFDWYDLPENEGRKTRFSFAMACSTKLEPPAAILAGFKWADLPKNSIVVDVGGGVGSSSLILAKAAPHLNLIVQDRRSVIEDAKREEPELLLSGRVKLTVHDFFTPMPVKTAAVFLLRWIMHDWADPHAVQILAHLRAAAAPDTKLVTVDIILPYACADTCVTNGIPGAALAPPPAPLLPNLGAANSMKYWLDFQMFVLGNCQERTLGHFVSLAGQSGWRVVQVHHIPGSSLGQYISVPA